MSFALTQKFTLCFQALPFVRGELVGHDAEDAVRLDGDQADGEQARHVAPPRALVLNEECVGGEIKWTNFILTVAFELHLKNNVFQSTRNSLASLSYGRLNDSNIVN